MLVHGTVIEFVVLRESRNFIVNHAAFFIYDSNEEVHMEVIFDL